MQHHENEKNEPKGLLSIEGTRKFLEKNSQIDVDKFDFPGYGDAFYRGPLESLNIAWNDGKTKLPTISPAGKDISIIFSESIEEIKDKIWSKTLTKSELQWEPSLLAEALWLAPAFAALATFIPAMLAVVQDPADILRHD